MAFRLPFRSPSRPPEAPPGDVPSEVEVVPMRRKDVRSVVVIEEQIFPRPWSAALYLSELAQPATRAYYVARSSGLVVGYAGLMIVAGEGHVTTVGVAPAWQGRRIGMSLLHRLATDARARGAEALTLEVRVTNRVAQDLYRQFGFVPAGIRKNYYAEVNEDGLVMWAHDVGSNAYAERLDAIASKLASQPPVRRRPADDEPLARPTDSPPARPTDSPPARPTDSPPARPTDSPPARPSDLPAPPPFGPQVGSEGER